MSKLKTYFKAFLIVASTFCILKGLVALLFNFAEAALYGILALVIAFIWANIKD